MQWQEHSSKKKFYPKKNVSSKKQRCIQTLVVSKETQQSSKFTQQPSIFLYKEKLRAYATVQSKPVCVRRNSSETHVYTWLWVQNLCTGRKVHKNKGKQTSWHKFHTNQTLPRKHAPRPDTETREKEKFKFIECW